MARWPRLPGVSTSGAGTRNGARYAGRGARTQDWGREGVRWFEYVRVDEAQVAARPRVVGHEWFLWMTTGTRRCLVLGHRHRRVVGQ